MEEHRINIMEDAPAAAAPAEQEEEAKPAGVAERFVALLIDWSIISIPYQLLAAWYVNHSFLSLEQIYCVFAGVNIPFIIYETVFSCGGRSTSTWAQASRYMSRRIRSRSVWRSRSLPSVHLSSSALTSLILWYKLSFCVIASCRSIATPTFRHIRVRLHSVALVNGGQNNAALVCAGAMQRDTAVALICRIRLDSRPGVRNMRPVV